MPVLSLLHLRAAIGARDLFHIDLAQLPRGRRAALVGPNGVGKSTLLRAIWRAHAAGASGHGRDSVAPDPPDSPVAYSGDIVLEGGASLAYLPQRPPDGGMPLPPALCARWELPDRPLDLLSAGQRTRAALATALAQAPDLLLLDEPTNHLDARGLELLEQALSAFRGALLLVSHDRAFLDRIATEVWELDRPWEQGGAGLRVFPGNYGAYRQQAALAAETERRAHAAHTERREHLEKAARRQMEWARRAFADPGPRNPGAQRLAKKMAHRAKAYEHRLERAVGDAPPQPWERDRVALPVSGATFGGARLVVAEGLAVGPAGPHGPVVARCPRLDVGARARVALTGGNGAGKTTLLRTLAGELQPVDGRLWVSPSARIAYVAQERDEASGVSVPRAAGATALDVLGSLPGASRDAAWSTAALLGLRRERAGCRFADLSGGERTAVALAAALQAGAHLLLLDEPTNHLDLWLREAVEAALGRFPGAVVLATHDRWLVAHWAEEEWRVEGGALRRAAAAAGGQPVAGADGPVPAGGGQTMATATGDAEGGDPARDLARRMRLAELSARLADPRWTRRAAERAALEEEFRRLSRPPQGG